MVRAWRIVKARHAATAFDGEGARLHGGRWNSPGRPAVYASESRAMATLELLAGLGTDRVLSAYVLIGLRFDSSLLTSLDGSALPVGWDARPPAAASRMVGDAWLLQQSSVALRVPSVVVPAEHNYLLNPRHPDFGEVEIDAPVPVSLDPRLLGR